MAAILSSSSPPNLLSTLSPSSLDDKFGRKGISFAATAGAVELAVRNGSSLSLRLSDAVVTSYKPKVYWKDGEAAFEEVVYTTQGDRVRGGIGLVLNEVDGKEGGWSVPCCFSDWVVTEADSDSFDAVQVELACTNEKKTLDIKYVISLFQESMATAVSVKNNGPEPIKIMSAILSHLSFKKRNQSAIEGLRGCSYCTHAPLSSSFEIMTPAEATEVENPSFLDSLLSNSGNDSKKNDGWTVENNIYTVLEQKMSRVYTAPPSERLKRIYRTPPSKYETIDKKSELGFRVIRMGYEDIYLASPGSLSKNYGKDYFICTGPASMLVPVEIEPGEAWRGAQVIEHDNL